MNDLPAHMSNSQAALRTGTMTLAVIARWDVRTRSKSGAETRAATMPLKIKVAPIRPAEPAE